MTERDEEAGFDVDIDVDIDVDVTTSPSDQSAVREPIGVIDLTTVRFVPVRTDGATELESSEEVRPSGGLALLDAGVTRLVDMLGAFVLLLVLAPLMVVVAVAVVATSPGPALFRQQRCGRRGQSFTMLKFRTMSVDAEAQAAVLESEADRERVDAPAFKSPDDPRVTPLGRWLRRTSIDELPQLINVLVGQMALVGPRPLVQSEADVLPEDAFGLRHSVRPGLTGQWQVDRHGDTTFVERMVMDLEYAATRTVVRDVRLLLRTPASIVRGAGCF